MDLQREIGVFRKWLPLIAIAVVLAAGVGFVVSSFQPKVYEAKATLIVGQSLSGVNPDYTQLLASQRLSTTYATLATTGPLLEKVIADLGLQTTAAALSRDVVAEAPTDSTLVTVTARASDPAEAANIANAVAKRLVEGSPALQGSEVDFRGEIQTDLTAVQAEISSTQQRVKELLALDARTPAQDAQLTALEDRLVSLWGTFAALLSYSSGTGSNLLSVVDPAVPAASPIAPRTLLNVLLAAILAAVVASGIVLIIGYLDDTVKTGEDAETVTGLATLGTILQMKGAGGRGELYRLETLLYPRSRVAEGYRTLRTSIEFAAVDHVVGVLLVTSSLPREGKTVTAANLAVVFAQAGRRVLLVDADLRQPGAHVIFGLDDNSRGLTTLLTSEAPDVEAVAQKTELTNLRVLTSGSLPPNPAELLGSQRMRTLLDHLRASADLVIFDSPPLQAVADSAVVSSFSDATILVIDANRSRRAAVRRSKAALDRAGANTIGTVLNRVPVPSRGDQTVLYGGYYGSREQSDVQGSPDKGTFVS